MSRHNKTFAPRANRSEAQTTDNKEEQEKYISISSQDAKISLAKTEVTQITYGPFRNRAFNKVERGSSIIKFPNNGLHVLVLNKALNELGYQAPENETFFGDKTKKALMSFQSDYGIQKSGILDRETLLKMDRALGKLKDKKNKKDNDSIALSATLEKPKTTNSKDDDSVIYTIVVAKNQKFNGKLIQTDENLNHFAEFKMNLTRHLKWNPKFTDEQVKNIVTKGGSVNYRISAKEHTIEKEAEALSPDKKQFIRNPASTADYIQNTRILDLLKQLSEEEIADYKSKVSQETNDLTAIEESLKAYIQERDKNFKKRDELETVKTKLYGLEKLYDQYIKYLGISPTTNIGSIKEPLIVDNPNYSFAEKELTGAMKANGFASIKEFEDYIRRYESAFETETVRIGVEMLQHYKHTLYQEEKKLNDTIFLDHLSQSIIKSGAQEDYETGKSIKSNSKKVLGHGISYTDQQEYNLGQSKINNANKSISLLSSQTPLVNDPDFDKEEFAEISNKTDLKEFLNEYITSQNEKVDSVINNITENPEHIYELDNLFKASYEKQHIEKGSIYDRIITAKYDRLKGLEILLAICEGIFALALIVVTWGAATPVVIAGGALSLAVSIDVAYDTIKEYKDNKEFHDVGLLSDDPSLIWVVVAIAGVALDAAALGALLKSAKPIAAAGKAFNEAEDATSAIANLESDLAKIEGLEERVQQNIVRHAKIQAQEKKILDGFVKARQLTYATIPGLSQTGELLARAVFAIRKGIVTFDSFIAELKLAKVIKETGLNPEELLAVKNAFEKARTLAKDEKLVTELEKAIAENDVAKVKSLLGGTSTEAKNGSKITGKIEGLYSEINPNYKPKGFESIKDIEDFDPKYGREITTSFDDYDGYFIRNFDSKNKIFTFNHGFIEDLPKWVEDVKIPLVEGKGIPTQAYFTLRQMKLLKIAEGEIQTVRMAQIQNLETMGYIHQVTGGKIIRNFDSIDILDAPSNGYMKTVMTQAGYETISGRITGKGQYFSIKQLKSRQWDISDEFMQKYNLSESSMLYMNFNIEVKVKYIKK